MSIKVRVSFDIEVDSPATISAYGVALGFALRSAAANAEKIAEHPGAQVSMGEVDLKLEQASGASHG